MGIFDLEEHRAVKELLEAAQSGDEEKIQEWKEKYSDREEKGTFRF